MFALSGLLLAAILAACSSSGQSNVAAPGGVSTVEFKTWSSWSRRFGPYARRVIFHANLSAEYSGLSFTDRKGEFRGTISERDWQSLLATLTSLGFDSMPTEFEPPHVFDSGYRQVTVTRGTDSKSVQDYDEAGSPAWQALVQHISNLTESVQWQPQQS